MNSNSLQITDIKVFLLNNQNNNNDEGKKGRTMAFASIVFNNAFRITGLRILQGAKGIFAAMPQRKDREGNFWDVAAPLNKDIYKLIQDEVLHKYTVLTAAA